MQLLSRNAWKAHLSQRATYSVIFLTFIPQTPQLFLMCKIPVWQKEIIHRSCLWSVRRDWCSCFLHRKQPGRLSTMKSLFSITRQNYFSCIQNTYSYQFSQYSYHVEAVLPEISHWLGRIICSVSHCLFIRIGCLMHCIPFQNLITVQIFFWDICSVEGPSQSCLQALRLVKYLSAGEKLCARWTDKTLSFTALTEIWNSFVRANDLKMVANA